MKKIKFKKIDAFATPKSDGNPAGYISLPAKDFLSPIEMLQIAKELKGFVNEVGFIYKDEKNILDLKFYSSEREVDFCGHATIAIMYDLILNDDVLKKNKVIQIRTNKGISTVENRISQENAVFIMAPLPTQQYETPHVADIVKAMNINENDINQTLPIKIINAGLSTLIVPLSSLNAVINTSPNFNSLKEFCINSNIDIIEIFTNEVFDNKSDFRTRVFAPKFGYLEDPATGSGNSALGYYLIEEQLYNNETIIIEQNALVDKFNIIKLQKKQDESGNTRILFGGGAITRIEGEYFIY